MNRINAKFEELKQKNKKALITFITSGDAGYETTEKAVEEAVWYGRFEMMNVAGHKVILDGAHNTDGVKALLTTMQYMRTEDTVFIFSGLKDKDVDEMIELIDEAGYPI